MNITACLRYSAILHDNNEMAFIFFRSTIYSWKGNKFEYETLSSLVKVISLDNVVCSQVKRQIAISLI